MTIGSDTERELGRLAGAATEIKERVDRIEKQVIKGQDDELARHDKIDGQLMKIEQQLSLGRFLLLTAKAVILTIAFALAFKFGDISSLWKALK